MTETRAIYTALDSLRYLLNKSAEKPKGHFETILDRTHTADGTTTRQHLENLWSERETILAALQAMKAPTPGPYWMSIEFAPTDGTHFVGYWEGYKRPFVCWYNQKAKCFESLTPDGRDEEQPTHYIPLPLFEAGYPAQPPQSDLVEALEYYASLPSPQGHRARTALAKHKGETK